MQGKFPVFGVNFVALPQNSVLEEIVRLAHFPKASSVLFANAHVIVEADENPGLKNLLNEATLVVPDGVPVSWVLHARGQRQAQRYSGPDLMLDVFKKDPDAKHFLLGSTPETLEKMKARVEKEFGANVAGVYSPPFTGDLFTDEEKAKQLDLVEKSGANYVWVGLGAPKQEKHAVEMARRASNGAWLAVGAAFDFLAGNKPRAPKPLQRAGLEWAFRMVTEPKRLGSRYLRTNPIFIKLALGEIFTRAPK